MPQYTLAKPSPVQPPVRLELRLNESTGNMEIFADGIRVAFFSKGSGKLLSCTLTEGDAAKLSARGMCLADHLISTEF